MKRKKMWVIVILIIAVLAAGGYFYFQKWLGAKQMKIQLGLASDKFPWRDFSQDELNKLYPQIKYADVPTRVTPEQTYANFREALRTNNLAMAVAQLAVGSKNYQENKKKIKDAYKDNKFKDSLNIYPEKVWKSTFGESMGSLCYEQKRNNSKFVGCMDFLKDASGDWKMDSL